MANFFGICSATILLTIACVSASAQPPQSSPAAKPTEHLIGTVTAVDNATHAITVKQDKTGTEQKVQIGSTKTLLKVEPGAKDLKSAVRITADDLQVGDRVDVRGMKSAEDANAITARSVVLMTARDLQRAHQAEAAAWQHSTPGVVTSVDPASGTLEMTVKAPGASRSVKVETSKTTQFSRYSPETPQTPAVSEFAQIRPGDQLRVIGTTGNDGSTITAERVYSGAFRTINGTITSIASDGKSLTVKNLATKQPVELALNDHTEIRKLPPQMAMMLARRLNPSLRARPGSEGQHGGPPQAEPGEAGARPPSPESGAEERGPGHNMRGESPAGRSAMAGGNISQMIEKLPPIAISDLKPGDAVVISGVETGAGDSRLLATNIVAGVEPILQSAPSGQRGSQATGDWGLGQMTIPE